MLRVLPLLLLFAACRPTVSTVVFHTDMGEMTVCIAPNLPGEALAQLDLLRVATTDSLAVGKVLHDGFIQLNFPAADISTPDVSQGVAVSGAFVLSAGRFYLVQGRGQTDASLDKWEAAAGRKIPLVAREQYKKKGGALQLDGKCLVLGALASGREVLDRIAALPSDAAGRPLRAVPVRVQGR